MSGSSAALIGKLAEASIGGTALFVVCTLLMHVMQPGLRPLDDAVSYYMNGPSGWVLGAGLIALGAGSLCLAGSVYLQWGVMTGRVALWALAIWGLGATIGGIFAPDPMGQWDKPPSLSGALHAYSAMVAFLAFPVASLRLSRPMSHLARESGLATLLWWLAILGMLTLALFFVCLAPVFAQRPPILIGLVERILLVLQVAWLAAAAIGVRRIARRTG